MNMFMEKRRFRRDGVLEAVECLGELAASLGISVAQLALAWVLRRPEVSSAIIGASRPEQIRENARASELRIPEETLEAAGALLAPVAATE
jgi:aryl-alcohol dehydrogenase-like predicted oxidoreductase